MTDVGIRELKARLSEFVERAARGEVIRVTDRGLPKALLSPLPGRDRIEEGIAAGWIQPARGQARGPWRRFRSSRSIAEVLEEDRGT
jgi:prevent-host-death family protein